MYASLDDILDDGLPVLFRLTTLGYEEPVPSLSSGCLELTTLGYEEPVFRLLKK